MTPHNLPQEVQNAIEAEIRSEDTSFSVGGKYIDCGNLIKNCMIKGAEIALSHIEEKGEGKEGWISVEDSLPTDEVPVMVVVNGHILGHFVHRTLHSYTNGKWIEDGSPRITERITHWQTLPEPPYRFLPSPPQPK